MKVAASMLVALGSLSIMISQAALAHRGGAVRGSSPHVREHEGREKHSAEDPLDAPATGDDDGDGVGCPPQSVLDLIVQKGRVDCGPKCVYKHYDAEIKVEPLPSGIKWQSLWKAAGLSPAVYFELANHGTCSSVYKTPEGQWNLRLDKRRVVRTGPIDKSHNGTFPDLVTQCPWCDATGPTDCSTCGTVPLVNFQDSHVWQINAENQAYLAELEPSSTRGVLCLGTGSEQGSQVMGADMCTGGKAWTYSFSGAQVYTTGGCSTDGVKCPSGTAFCCPNGSKPGNVTSCGDYCFNCNGSC